jgi:seryl-tRNA synthetase
VATPRGLIALIENNYQEDGSVKIPKVLQPYMGGKEIIKC